MQNIEITKEIEIEDLVRLYPFSIRFLADKGIKCIACGEPIWGSLQDACEEKGFSSKAINNIVEELKNLA